MTIAAAIAVAFAFDAHSSLLGELRDADAAADAAVASIRTVAELADKQSAWRTWWLDTREGKLAENHAAILAMMGRSRVGVKAEAILRKAAKRVAANGGKPVVLEAKGADCIAAAHAYAAEPQLFSEARFTDAPPSWTEMATNPDPRLDSFAVAVWGALREYDWTELTKGGMK